MLSWTWGSTVQICVLEQSRLSYCEADKLDREYKMYEKPGEYRVEVVACLGVRQSQTRLPKRVDESTDL